MELAFFNTDLSTPSSGAGRSLSTLGNEMKPAFSKAGGNDSLPAKPVTSLATAAQTRLDLQQSPPPSSLPSHTLVQHGNLKLETRNIVTMVVTMTLSSNVWYSCHNMTTIKSGFLAFRRALAASPLYLPHPMSAFTPPDPGSEQKILLFRHRKGLLADACGSLGNLPRF